MDDNANTTPALAACPAPIETIERIKMQPKIKNKKLQKQIDQLFNRDEVICASIAVRDADTDKFVVATRLGTDGGYFEAAAAMNAKLFVWSATKRIGLTGQTQEEVQA